MIPFARAVDQFLSKLLGEALEQIAGVPDDDLNHWRPALAMEDVNTFFALLTHTLASTEYWILHAAGGRAIDRNRPAEFRATGSRADLVARTDRLVLEVRAYLETLTEPELGNMFERAGEAPLRWTAADCIVHAVEHVGVHVGHLQLQRQIWNAERRERSSGAASPA